MRNCRYCQQDLAGNHQPDCRSPEVRETLAVRTTTDFFEAKTIEQLVEEQDIKPIQSLDSLAGAFPDEDIDEMLEEIYRARRTRAGI